MTPRYPHARSILLCLLIAIVASGTPAISAAPMAWPVQVSANGRYFVDQKGQPVFWLGTTQWELFRGYRLEDAQLILDQSKDKGFVFVQTMLVGVGDGTRANVYGQKPWLNDDPLTPNEAYFQNVDAVIRAARERDLILYVMAYHQTCRKHITVANARSWANPATGESVAGGSYANAGVQSFTTPVGWEDSLLIIEPAHTRAETAPAFPLKLSDDQRYLVDQNQVPFLFLGDSPWSLIVEPTPAQVETYLDDRRAKGFNVLLVTAYEGEHNASAARIRRQAYWPLLCGAFGVLYGNSPVWHFGSRGVYDRGGDWPAALNSRGAKDVAHLAVVFRDRPWWQLRPDRDHQLVTAGYGTFGQLDYVTAARAADGTLGLAYLPSTGKDRRELTVDLGQFNGPVGAQWFNPTDGRYTAIAGSPFGNTEPRAFTTPGDNGTGDNDWLLMLESRPNETLVRKGAAAAEVRPEGRDSAALAAAIQRSEAGTTIRLPEGTFELTESVRLKSRVKLIGAGQDKTIFIYSGDQPDPFISLTDCEDVEIAHLTLDGRHRPLGQDGIRAGNCRKLLLHHLTIRNLAKGKSSFVHGIIFSGRNPTMERGVTDSVISDCHMETVGLGAEYGGGIRMAWGSARNRVERNVIRDTGRGGIFGDHSAELVIRHNQVSGSGGEGLGIEIWGGCPRSLIEDNVVDHWISVDQGNQSAVRRNIVGVEDDSLKGYGIEIIASDVIVTDNLVKRGAAIGLSVSNKPKKNNVFWGYNTIRECVQWGAQLQGETGGIAHHYFYRCTFEKTIRGDPRARYPRDSGHGFRFNGSSRELVFEECAFRDNGGYGVQFGGPNVDAMAFLRCVFTNNQGLVIGLSADKTVEFKDCTAGSDTAGAFPPTQAFSSVPPIADFRVPPVIRAGAVAPFECTSRSGAGEIVGRLWDFNHGIAEVVADPQHIFDPPGKYRVTLTVWDATGRGARAEKLVEVLPAQ